ncbi:hypothetical protein ACJX0J_005804, partial [Zea mays]
AVYLKIESKHFFGVWFFWFSVWFATFRFLFIFLKNKMMKNKARVSFCDSIFNFMKHIFLSVIS